MKCEVTKIADKIELWAIAITKHEGYYPGSLTYRLNNPGALRQSPFQAGIKGGFAYFKTYQEGWKGLIHQLTIAASGKSRIYKPTDTLLEFFRRYAPAQDSNNPDAYAKQVAKEIGITVNTQIKTLLV